MEFIQRWDFLLTFLRFQCYCYKTCLRLKEHDDWCTSWPVVMSVMPWHRATHSPSTQWCHSVITLVTSWRDAIRVATGRRWYATSYFVMARRSLSRRWRSDVTLCCDDVMKSLGLFNTPPQTLWWCIVPSVAARPLSSAIFINVQILTQDKFVFSHFQGTDWHQPRGASRCKEWRQKEKEIYRRSQDCSPPSRDNGIRVGLAYRSVEDLMRSVCSGHLYPVSYTGIWGRLAYRSVEDLLWIVCSGHRHWNPVSCTLFFTDNLFL